MKGRNEDFAHIRVNLSRAFDLVPYIINSESLRFDKSNIRSRLMEAMTPPREHHAMHHSEETTVKLAQKVCQSLALVSHCTSYIFYSSFWFIV